MRVIGGEDNSENTVTGQGESKKTTVARVLAYFLTSTERIRRYREAKRDFKRDHIRTERQGKTKERHNTRN